MPRPLLPTAVAALGAAALALLTAGGCRKEGGAPLPPTHPVRGKVTFKGGGALSGGTVEFRSEADASPLTSGEIRKDGAYALVTRRDGRQAAGAPAGKYRVTVLPPMGEDQAGQPVDLPTPYTVQPGDNEINLEVPRPRRR